MSSISIQNLTASTASSGAASHTYSVVKEKDCEEKELTTEQQAREQTAILKTAGFFQDLGDAVSKEDNQFCLDTSFGLVCDGINALKACKVVVHPNQKINASTFVDVIMQSSWGKVLSQYRISQLFGIVAHTNEGSFLTLRDLLLTFVWLGKPEFKATDVMPAHVAIACFSHCLAKKAIGDNFVGFRSRKEVMSIKTAVYRLNEGRLERASIGNIATFTFFFRNMVLSDPSNEELPHLLLCKYDSKKEEISRESAAREKYRRRGAQRVTDSGIFSIALQEFNANKVKLLAEPALTFTSAPSAPAPTSTPALTSSSAPASAPASTSVLTSTSAPTLAKGDHKFLSLSYPRTLHGLIFSFLGVKDLNTLSSTSKSTRDSVRNVYWSFLHLTEAFSYGKDRSSPWIRNMRIEKAKQFSPSNFAFKVIPASLTQAQLVDVTTCFTSSACGLEEYGNTTFLQELEKQFLTKDNGNFRLLSLTPSHMVNVAYTLFKKKYESPDLICAIAKELVTVDAASNLPKLSQLKASELADSVFVFSNLKAEGELEKPITDFLNAAKNEFLRYSARGRQRLIELDGDELADLTECFSKIQIDKTELFKNIKEFFISPRMNKSRKTKYVKVPLEQRASIRTLLGISLAEVAHLGI